MKLAGRVFLAAVAVTAMAGTAAAGQDWDRYYREGRLREEIRREVRESLRESLRDARRAVRDARRDAFRASRDAWRDRARAHREYWREHRHRAWGAAGHDERRHRHWRE
jgi:hypothetical protein